MELSFCFNTGVQIHRPEGNVNRTEFPCRKRIRCWVCSYAAGTGEGTAQKAGGQSSMSTERGLSVGSAGMTLWQCRRGWSLCPLVFQALSEHCWWDRGRSVGPSLAEIGVVRSAVYSICHLVLLLQGLKWLGRRDDSSFWRRSLGAGRGQKADDGAWLLVLHLLKGLPPWVQGLPENTKKTPKKPNDFLK